RSLRILATRGLGVLTARSLRVLAARSLGILTARGLLNRARGLRVLTARGLRILATRSLRILAPRSLRVLTARGLPRRARGLRVLAPGHGAFLREHLLGLGHLGRAGGLSLADRREGSHDGHAHEGCKESLHLVSLSFCRLRLAQVPAAPMAAIPELVTPRGQGGCQR